MGLARKAPKVRFPGNQIDWKTEIFGNFVLESAFGPRFSSDLYSDDGQVATLRTTDLDHDGNICYSTMPFANLNLESFKDHLLQKGDLVVSRSGTIGITAVFTDFIKPVLPGAFLIRFRLDETSISPHFVKSLFNSSLGKRKLSSLAAGGVQKNLTGTSIKDAQFIFPSFKEQQKIASFLSSVDERIGLLEQKKEKLELYKRGVMQQIFSQQIRFRQDDGTEFPDWEERKLGEVARIYDGTHQTPKYVESGVPFFSVEHVSADQFEKTKFISEEVFEKENRRVKLEKGDILMTRIGSIGVAKHIDWDVRASFYVSLALLKNAPSFNSKYLAYYIHTQSFQKELWKRTIHVAFPQKINLGEIGECKVRLPPLDEQEKIANFLISLDKSLESLSQEIKSLRDWKKGLLQQMFV